MVNGLVVGSLLPPTYTTECVHPIAAGHDGVVLQPSTNPTEIKPERAKTETKSLPGKYILTFTIL
jgi:hypothetical protein